jgi:hypothetical protein
MTIIILSACLGFLVEFGVVDSHFEFEVESTPNYVPEEKCLSLKTDSFDQKEIHACPFSFDVTE